MTGLAWLGRSLLTAAVAAGPVAALAATPFDGVYKGGTTLTSTKGGRVVCPPGIQFSVQVRDGTFNWKLDNASETVKVGPDGAFNASNGRRFLSGKIADGKFAGQSTGEYCVYAWALTR